MEIGGLTLEAELLKLLDGGVNSPVAICVGTSEGTRTPDGRKTAAWNGHVDPGNGAHNQGSFSYQHSAASPKDADLQQIKKFKDVLLPKFLKAIAPKEGINLDELKILWLVACDLFTQSEAACTLKGGFLDQIKDVLITKSVMIGWRVEAYRDPSTGLIDAPGFLNDEGRILADQKRRTEAVITAAKKLGIF